MPKISSVYLLLHDIRSVHNVGSIFRTADAFGVKKIYISGYTPAPVDRFGRKRADFIKVSLGAEDSVEWKQIWGTSLVSIVDFIKEFKKQNNATVIALEQDAKSIDYRDVGSNVGKYNPDVLLIVGREVEGIDSEILALANVIAEIPMRGKKESLNVSVAVGVALFGIFK